MVLWPQLTSLTSCSNPHCPILLASAGGMQVGCRSWSISAAGQAFGRPCDTSFCPLQPLANVSTRSGCCGQAWCCYTPSLPASQPGLAHPPPTWVGNRALHSAKLLCLPAFLVGGISGFPIIPTPCLSSLGPSQTPTFVAGCASPPERRDAFHRPRCCHIIPCQILTEGVS